MRKRLEEVFVTAGVPEITYVEPREFLTLKVALRTPGKCVVVEGPSGIGKTTAINKVAKELGLSDITFLSARKNSDAKKLLEVSAGDFTGTVIIDDFHRADSKIKKDISDVMKYLADEEVRNKKIIVVGINRVGDSLIKFSPDLNNRISTIRFENNTEDKVEELIIRGQNALNIEFDNVKSIVDNSYGSFHIAQLMCHKACLENRVTEEQDTKTRVHFSFPRVQASLSEEFSRSYFEIVRVFSTGNRLRREGRAPYLHILKWLAGSNTWSVSLATEVQKHPEAKASVTQIIEKGYLEDFLRDPSHSSVSEYIHFDQNTRILSAEDPKFVFYLKTLNWNNVARDIGYIQPISERKYDFALSFAGSERAIARKIFEKLSEHELSVFFDTNEQASILSMNVEEYLQPIYNSEAIYVVPLLSKNYPERIWTKFESNVFRRRFGNNAVIPIWFSDADSILDISRDFGGIEFDPQGDVDEQINKIVELLAKKMAEYRIG